MVPLPTTSAGRSGPMPWLTALVYATVLTGGLYGGMVTPGPTSPLRLCGFTACLLLLAGLDLLERRRHPLRTPPRPAATLFVTRLALFAAASVLDRSGVSRALFLLVPFVAFFTFGRRFSIASSAACVGVLLAGNVMWVPGWYLRADIVTDLLMFSLGLILAVAMAATAVVEQEGRVRLGHTLDRLRDSHTQLTDYAARVGQLSATQERNRLAREFHDGLGHHLTVIAIQLEKASAFQDLDTAVARQAIADARWSAGRALDEVRQSVRVLRDEPEEPFSLSAALAGLVRHSDGGPAHVTLDVSGEEHGYDTESLTALYRAAQEALTNAHRHAHATRVAVAAVYGEREARLVVTDDGVGFPSGADTDAAWDGFGLRAMRERLGLLGGRVEIKAAEGGGTVVTVTVPRVPQLEGAP